MRLFSTLLPEQAKICIRYVDNSHNDDDDDTGKGNICQYNYCRSSEV
jgi:hypothetical protein